MSNSIVVKEDFDRLHNIVKEHLSKFWEVWRAIGEIKERKLYMQGGYSTWSDYCTEELGMTDRNARRILQASSVAEKYQLPTERATRELLKHPEEDRAEIVEIAKSRQGGDVTGSMIQDVAWEVANPSSTEGTVRPQTHEFTSIIQAIIQVGQRVNALSEESCSAHLDMGQIRASLKTAHDYVKAGIPTHECYACNGKGCKICKDLGWIPEAVFDRRPTEFS